jgi:CRP-like cAMP-binding protein
MVVSYLNPGEFFGEMSLFGEETRTANLVTRTEQPASSRKLATTTSTQFVSASLMSYML